MRLRRIGNRILRRKILFLKSRIEGFLKKLRPEVMSVTRVKTRGEKIIRAGGARATYGEGQRGKE